MIENYIIYEYVKEKNDIKLINEFYNKTDVIEFLGISQKHFSDYNIKDIENIDCRLKDNKYFIFTEFEPDEINEPDNYNDLIENI